MKAIFSFLKNANKELKEDDLKNTVATYQTDFEFVKGDIEHHRNQGLRLPSY